MAEIKDTEELYRSVRESFDEYYINDEGKLIITDKAFNDRGMEPSVSISSLLDKTPELAKLGDGQGIVSLIVGDVREIGDVKTDNEEHLINVISDPIDDPNEKSEKIILRNNAHALVVVDPKFYGSNNRKNKTFKLLRKALARLATENGWTLEPNI